MIIMYYIDKLRIIKHIIIIQSVIHSPTGLFKESVNIIKELRASETLKQKIYALLIVLAGKVVDPAQLESAWEEVKLMGNKILEYAEERCLKLGEERGLKRGENLKAEEVTKK